MRALAWSGCTEVPPQGLEFALTLGRGAALECHWHSIHSRTRSSPFIVHHNEKGCRIGILFIGTPSGTRIRAHAWSGCGSGVPLALHSLPHPFESLRCSSYRKRMPYWHPFHWYPLRDSSRLRARAGRGRRPHCGLRLHPPFESLRKPL